MMSTSLSSQQDSRPGRLSPTKGEGGTAASSMPFVSFLEMRTSQEPVLPCNLSTRRGSRGWAFPSGSLAVCSILGMSCTRFCLPPPNQQASLPSELTAPLAADRPWEPGDRGSENAPIASLPPTAGSNSPVVAPTIRRPETLFLLPSCGVRRTTVFCASHPSYEVVWLSAESGPQPAPSCRLDEKKRLSRRFGPHSSTTTPLHPASGASTQRPSSRLETVQRREREGGGEDDAILSDPHQGSLLFPSGYAVHPICFCFSLLLRCPCREACPEDE